MTETWKEHCPVDEEESPVERQAWHGGWKYRKERGPGTPKMEVAVEMAGDPGLLKVWLQGYAAADNHFADSGSNSFRP